MYNVIIVEDELFVRLGIKNSIAWEDYDMQVVADAENGQVAWTRMQEYAPDILITDILMPVLDETALISRMKEAGMDCYVIVITCMEDFHLIKDLLNNGIRDYLLKSTITEHELGNCLLKAKTYLDKHSVKHHGSIPAFINESEICSQIMQAYLQDSTLEQDTYSLLESHHISLKKDHQLLALCPIEAVYDYQGNVVSMISKDIYRNLFDLLKQRSFSFCSCNAFLIEEQYFIILLHWNGDDFCLDQAVATFRSLHDDLQDYLNISLSFLLFQTTSGLANIRTCYQQALISLENHYLHPMNSVICTWEDCSKLEIAHVIEPLSSHNNWISRCLGHSSGDKYHRLLDDLTRNTSKSKEEMTYCMMSISHFICSFFDDHLIDNQKQCNKLLIRYPYLYEGITALNSLLQSCEQYCLKRQKPLYRKEIEAALSIIEKDFAKQELSLSFVAAQVGLSDTYFSTLFKQELEKPFIKYLSAFRIEHSKTLLAQTDCKMFDIAIQCGFSDEAYFSRVFKKTAGISPSEWRSLWYL